MEPPQSLLIKQRKLRNLRRAAAQCWGLTAVVLVGYGLWSMVLIRNSADDLLQTGPVRQLMMAKVEGRIRQSVGSRLKSDVGNALHQIQPILKDSAKQADDQSAEAAHVAVQVLTSFRDDLAGTCVKPLDDQLLKAMDARQKQIDAHADGKTQTDLDDESHKVFEAMHAGFVKKAEPFVGPYRLQVSDILTSILKIRDQEASNVRGVVPTWDMDLMVLEEMHREVAASQSAPKEAAK